MRGYCKPFDALPYGTARVLWLVTIAVALALFALLWRGGRRPVALALCWSFPVAFGFVLGQDTALLAFKITFLFALAIPFLRSRRAAEMIGIRSLTSALPFPGIAYALGFGALMFWLWRIAADALIAAPHCYVYDGVLLIPLLAKFASFENWPGRAALFALSPLPFLAILLGTTRATALTGGALLIFSTCVVLQHSVAMRRAKAPARQRRACPAVA
jgi:hypothetical protein